MNIKKHKFRFVKFGDENLTKEEEEMIKSIYPKIFRWLPENLDKGCSICIHEIAECNIEGLSLCKYCAESYMN